MPDKSVENADADKVDEALKLLAAGQLAQAKAILLDVASRCPDRYVYDYTEGGTRYIKFWALQEFLAFCATLKESGSQAENVVWVRSAYPRAFYYLGYVSVEEGDIAGALRWLARGREVEPTNPRFLTEMGAASNKGGKPQQAIEHYAAVLKMEPAPPPNIRAVAWRGIGYALIELHRLDAVAEAYEESLKLDPDNDLAKSELRHIRTLKARSAET